MPFVKTSSGHQWFLSVEGKGPALMFIHGWAVDSRIWLQQQNYFSKKFQVLAIDFPGHGQTPWQDLTLEDMAKDFFEILAKSGEQRAHIVGSSFGGLLGLKILELFPKNVRSLVFVGSQPKFVKALDNSWGLAPERIAKLKSQLELDYPAVVPIFFRSLFTATERKSEGFKRLQGFRKNDGVPAQAALLKLLQILCAADLRQILQGATVPMQFINGNEDYICPAGLYGELRKKIPEARFDEMKGCGHFPFVSQPTEFNQLLENFFEDVDG